jgi:2,3-bisphosphoglycerate-independent phosphoglycerate mutase
VSRVLLVFIDGVGVGPADAARNPLVDLPVLGNLLPDAWSPPQGGGRPESLPGVRRATPVPHGGLVRATDASLDMPGLPQSATGQTTLFTGENAARALGHHLYGYPGPTLRELLRRHSVLKRTVEAGRSGAFLNAYRPLFFDLGEDIWKRPMSASSWNNRAAGLPFRTFEDIAARRALYHDFTNAEAIQKGFDLPSWSPEEAGAVLAEAARHHDFVIYEYFLTDRVGHTGDLSAARALTRELDRFLAAAAGAIDKDEQTLVLTSDHGNVEDMSTKGHTFHPVPAMVWGAGAERLLPGLARLEDFANALLEEIGAGA